MEEKKIINDNIKRALIFLRQNNNLKQTDIAKVVNKSPTGVASWEQGRCVPSPEDLYTLSKYYNVNMDYFFHYGDIEGSIECSKVSEKYPLTINVTAGEYKLIHELRERDEVSVETLEKMFNTILEYKQKDSNFKIVHDNSNVKFSVTVTNK